MPFVIFVLPAQPAVVIDARVEADFVAGRAKFGGAKEGFEHLLLVHDRPRLQRRVVQETPSTGRGRGEEVGILLLVRDIVVAVAGPAVDLVDGVAAQTGQPCLGLRRGAIDLATHLAGQHQRRVVAARTPLRLDLALPAL